MPIDHVTGWLFRVARNRITDLFRKHKPETFSDTSVENEDGELLQIEDLLPSPDAGPEALYVRNVLLDELEVIPRSSEHRIIENRRIAGLTPVWFAPHRDVKGSIWI
jgi:DNA-directed RNA polymerase specialized sigma24 family protein